MAGIKQMKIPALDVRQRMILEELRKRPVPPAPTDNGVPREYFTVPELARLIRVQERTVWMWIRQRELRAVKIGRQWRIGDNDWYAFCDVRSNIQLLAL